jgi:hypothetical protein
MTSTPSIHLLDEDVEILQVVPGFHVGKDQIKTGITL